MIQWQGTYPNGARDCDLIPHIVQEFRANSQTRNKMTIKEITTDPAPTIIMLVN